MKFLGLMMQMRVRMGDGQAEGWWMDGGWQWWLEGRQQITRKVKSPGEKVKSKIKGDLQGQ